VTPRRLYAMDRDNEAKVTYVVAESADQAISIWQSWAAKPDTDVQPDHIHIYPIYEVERPPEKEVSF
jgi:hypothetical protein